MVDLKNLKTVLIILSVLLIVGSPYISRILLDRLHVGYLIAFSGGLLTLIAGLVLLLYSLKGETLS